jgi:hypothetical protein
MVKWNTLQGYLAGHFGQCISDIIADLPVLVLSLAEDNFNRAKLVPAVQVGAKAASIPRSIAECDRGFSWRRRLLVETSRGDKDSMS